MRSFTRIHLALDRPGRVQLAIFDAAGRRVRTLVDGTVPERQLAVSWDGRGARGQRVTPGVYYYRLRAADHATSGKLVVSR